MIGALTKWWRQFWCNHRFYIEDISRAPDGVPPLVSCPCHKCLKLYTAPYGLALPGAFDRKPVQ